MPGKVIYLFCILLPIVFPIIYHVVRQPGITYSQLLLKTLFIIISFFMIIVLADLLFYALQFRSYDFKICVVDMLQQFADNHTLRKWRFRVTNGRFVVICFAKI